MAAGGKSTIDVSAEASAHSTSFATSVWVVLALTAASIEPILIKLGFQAQATPLQLLVLKNLVAAVVMLVLVKGWKKPSNLRFGTLLLVSLLLFSTNALCLFALTKLSAVELITIITSTPAVVAVVNFARGHDSRGRLFWLGLVASLSGVLISLQVNLLQPQSFSLNAVGAILALAAVFSSTTYRVKIESLLVNSDPRLISFNIFVINGLISLLLTPWLGAVSLSVLPYALWMGIAAALANLAFIAAIKALGATRMSIINLIQRPMIIIIAALVLKETLSWPQVIGFALVMLGVHLAQVKPKVINDPAVVALVFKRVGEG